MSGDNLFGNGQFSVEDLIFVAGLGVLLSVILLVAAALLNWI